MSNNADNNPVSSVERRLNLCFFLLGRGGAATLREIAGAVEGYGFYDNEETLRRTFDRDRRALDESGVRVGKCRVDDPVSGVSSWGYEIVAGGFGHGGLRLRGEERRALLDFARCVSGGEMPVMKSFGDAVGKIAPGCEGMDGGGVVCVRLDFGGEGERVDEGVMDDVLAALNGGRRLRIRYRVCRGGEETERVVVPQTLFLREGRWYVVAFCEMRGAERVFRVDRISWSDVLGVAKEGQGGGQCAYAAFRSAAPWEIGGGEAVDVCVKFYGASFFIARNEWNHLSSVVFDEVERDVVVKVRNYGEFYRWVAAYGTGAEVVGPVVAREGMKAFWRRIADGA